jgi:hypothetical protein
VTIALYGSSFAAAGVRVRGGGVTDRIALELSGRDQMIHEPTTDPEALGDRRLFQTLL